MDHHQQPHHHHHQQQQQQHHYLLPQQQVHHHHHQHHSLQQHHQNQNQNNQSGGGGGVSGGVGGVDVTDRFPQWSLQETKELLMIRADLDQTFMETKRNKPLWEVIANRMKEKGYNRSPEQCKCKWKNLVTRYKGCETMEAETVRQQFPFYNELQAIFTSRMQRMLWVEAEGGGGGSGGGGGVSGGSGLRKNKSLSSDDEDDTNIDIELSEGSEQKAGNVGTTTSIKKKLKKMKSIGNSIGGGAGAGGKSLREMLEDFMRQQVQMEAEWREAAESREKERRAKEAEWRQAMKALESERVMMERSWREREEQRRVREEARAEKRDALITALLNKLRREDV